MNINEAIADIEKKFGKGAIMKLGDKPEKVDVIPSGCLSLDLAIGIGGYPRGRVVEMYSEPSVGKSLHALKAVANAQKLGKVAYIDSEFSLDLEFSEKLGVNTGDLLVSQVGCAEDAMTIVDTLLATKEFSLIVVDSIASLAPRAEIDGDYGDSNMGLMARLMSQSMRKLTEAVSRSNTCLLLLNQTRSKIGIVFGNPTTTPGGKAIPFYASLRIELAKAGQIKEGEEIVGHGIKAKIVKNKMATPFKVAEYELLYAEGISKEGDLINLGVKYGILEKSGSWIKYNGESLGQSKKVVEKLRENADLAEMIEDEIKAAIAEKK